MNRLVLLLFCIGVGPSGQLYAVSDQQFAQCQQIPKMNPNASPEEFNALAQRLKQAGVSVRTCVPALANRRVDRAREYLEQQHRFNVQQSQWVDSINKQFIQQDASGTRQIDYNQLETDLLPSEKKELEAAFESAKRNAVKVKVVTASEASQDVVTRFVAVSSDNTARAEGYTVRIPVNYSSYSSAAKKGNFIHLYGQLMHSDPEQENLLLAASYSINGNNQTIRSYGETFFNSPSFAYYQQTVLARADQVPAAIGTVEDARSMEAWLKAKIPSKLIGYLKSAFEWKKKANDANGSLVTRLAEVTRIRKLKEAEERIAKSQA